MIRMTLAAVVVGILLFLSSCASMSGPPASIYPDPTHDPDVYRQQDNNY